MSNEFLTVPHNVEAEQSVIGGLLLDDDNSESSEPILAVRVVYPVVASVLIL